jgi:hypothetical protein
MSDAGSAHGDAPHPAHDPYIVRRLEAAERQVAHLRRMVNYVFVGVAALLGITAAVIYLAGRHGMPGMVASVVESREFVLRDQAGQVRGVWGSEADGGIRLTLQGGANQSSVKLSLLADGSAGITLSDLAGNPRLVLGLLPDENVSIVFADGAGVTRAVLGLNADGSSSLIFAEKHGATRAAVGVDAAGQAIIATGDAQAGDTIQ